MKGLVFGHTALGIFNSVCFIFFLNARYVVSYRPICVKKWTNAATDLKLSMKRRDLNDCCIPDFLSTALSKGPNIQRNSATILQLNIGLLCNQACSHCHVESSPQRTEMMSMEVARRCIDILDNSPSITTVDLTGGMLLS